MSYRFLPIRPMSPIGPRETTNKEKTMNAYNLRMNCPEGRGEATLTMTISRFRRNRPAIAYAPESALCSCTQAGEAGPCTRSCQADLTPGTWTARPKYGANRQR